MKLMRRDCWECRVQIGWSDKELPLDEYLICDDCKNELDDDAQTGEEN